VQLLVKTQTRNVDGWESLYRVADCVQAFLKLGGQVCTKHLRDRNPPYIFDARACRTHISLHFVNVQVT
jgi:hypothetical protein